MAENQEYYEDNKKMVETELHNAKLFFNREEPDSTEMQCVEEMHRRYLAKARELVGKDVNLTMDDLKLVAFNAVIENMLHTYRQKRYEIDQPVEAYNILALYSLARLVFSMPDTAYADSEATYSLAEQAFYTSQTIDATMTCFEGTEDGEPEPLL